MNGYYILPDWLISIFSGNLPVTVPGVNKDAREICKLNKPVFFNMLIGPDVRMIGVGTLLEYSDGSVVFSSPVVDSQQYRFIIRNNDTVSRA